MPLRIGNFGNWGGDRPSDKPGHGYHPPACTCFSCIEAKHRAEEKAVAALLDAGLRQGTGIARTTKPPATQPVKSKSKKQKPSKKAKKTKKRFWPFGGAMLACLVMSVLMIGGGTDCADMDRPGFLEGRDLPNLDFLAFGQATEEPDQTPATEEQDPSIPERVWRRARLYAWVFFAPTGAVAVDPAYIEHWVIHYTNEERARVGLSQLRRDPGLSAMARAHSENMAGQDNLSHKLDGQGAANRMWASGNACFLGGAENIIEYPHTHSTLQLWEGDNASEWKEASHYENARVMAEGMVNSWMQSPGHWASIMDPKWQSIGVGAAHTPGEDKWSNGHLTFWGTQNFSGC